ncbi:WD40 repeat domain-containing protein, partial [Streptomyces sp. NPDC014684]|uniref:WD40 repeat domain-containing protein n=1 Tax=Streptomyces sp. NPDC014684 TaxID=3364880 RepID=UPI0036FEB692
AVTSLNGRPCAVTGDSGGSVRLWDLTTGTQIRKIARYNRGVTAVAVTSLNGRPCAVTGDSGGSVRLWDLTTGAHQSTFGLPAPVGAVAVAVAATPDVTLAVGFGHEVTVLTLVLTP